MSRVAATLFLLIAALPYMAMIWNPGEKADPVSGKAEVLKIVSPHRREEKAEYARGFREWMKSAHGRHVEIRWIDVGGTSKILKYLESCFETSPDAPGVDLMFGGGVAPFLAASRQGWLAPLDLPPHVLDRIPETCAGARVYDPERRWFGVALTGFGILYSRPALKLIGVAEPRDWDDLGGPEYYSWIASGDPRSSGSVHMFFEIILQSQGFERGWALITRICANVRGFGESSGVAPREVAAGDVAAGMVVDMFAREAIDAVGGDALALRLPQGATVISPDAVAAIRGGNGDLARLFVEYALSPEGQRILFQPAGANGQKRALHRMPVMEALYAEPGAPESNPYGLPATLAYDDGKASRRYGVLNDLMGAWLIDAQPELKEAWKKLISKGCPPEAAAQLCAPPLSEKELDDLAEAWGMPRLRHEVMARWATQARERYSRLAGG